MAWQFPQSVTQINTIVTLDDVNESVFVAKQVSLATVEDGGFISYAIRATNSGHQIVIAGTVSGLPLYISGQSTVTIDATGELRGFYLQAIELTALGDVTNHGLIATYGVTGVQFRSVGVAGASSFVNTGTVETAGQTALYHDVNAIDTLTVKNFGTITANVAFQSIATLAVDLITNSGKIVGNIELGGADDLYDGRLGTIQGNIFGGAGGDKLYAGAGDNRLFGQDGDDTLIGGSGADYLSGGADTDRVAYSSATSSVTVSLANPSINTGDAKGDTYSSIENLSGSNYDDNVFGNSAKNAINGGTGNDTIKGYAGNDILTGGTGDDIFVFNTALDGSTNFDTITDFNRVDDTIQVDNAYFIGLAGGALAAVAFKDVAVAAKDADDRIIYNSDTGNLYFDRDGSAGTYAAIKFAALTGSPTLTAADFVVI